MTVHIREISDRHIRLEFVNDTGIYPFIYMRSTCRLSRCLCIHGSHYRGRSNKLCYHATLAVRFLIDKCGMKVTP